MFTLAHETVYEEEIKKSRFIARGVPTNTPENALAYLDQIREVRATHHCWAYRIDQAYRVSGAGGLARAYGGCAAKCLQTARLKPVTLSTEVRLKVGFEDIGPLYQIIERTITSNNTRKIP